MILPAYANSRDTGRKFKGRTTIYEYGALRPLDALAATVTTRGAGRRTRTRAVADIVTEVIGELVTFPERLTLMPIRQRVGSRVVVRVTQMTQPDAPVEHGHKHVEWRCDCGSTGRMQVSLWRTGRSPRCVECSYAAKKQAYNPAPVVSARQRADVEAERMRSNPMSAVRA